MLQLHLPVGVLANSNGSRFVIRRWFVLAGAASSLFFPLCIIGFRLSRDSGAGGEEESVELAGRRRACCRWIPRPSERMALGLLASSHRGRHFWHSEFFVNAAFLKNFAIYPIWKEGSLNMKSKAPS